MIPELGHFALALALALSVAQAAFGLAGPWRGDPRLMAATPPVAVRALLAPAAAFGSLMWSFAANDMSVANVVQNSHSAKPMLYKLTATWGSHEGSMVLWVLILALCGGAVAAFGRDLPSALKARVLACFEGAALQTGARLEATYHGGYSAWLEAQEAAAEAAQSVRA